MQKLIKNVNLNKQFCPYYGNVRLWLNWWQRDYVFVWINKLFSNFFANQISVRQIMF